MKYAVGQPVGNAVWSPRQGEIFRPKAVTVHFPPIPARKPNKTWAGLHDSYMDTKRRSVMRRARRWNLKGDFYRYVASGYDSLAPTYDEEIGANPIGYRMRQIFRRALLAVGRPGDLVFEFGCGTGIDALWLARQGMDVVATDISEEMLEQLRRKAKAQELSDRVRCRRLAARDIGALRAEFGEEVFDGGYCHAGALNMEPELSTLGPQIRSLLKRDGTFVCSFINKISLFELLSYLAVLRPRKAFRRLDNVVPIPISRREPLNRYVVPTRFYTPRDMIRTLGGGFRVRGVEGMQVFLPPSNLAELYAAARPVFVPLDWLERLLSKRWPVNSWGHHTILTLQKI